MTDFDDDYKFILSLRRYVSGRDYIAINNRLLSIIDKYQSIDTNYGKYAWLCGHAYFYLNRKCFHKGVITNFEKYLNKVPFSENYKDTYICMDPKQRIFIKLPITQKELEHAKLTHFQNIYYLLAKTCQQENEISKAKNYANIGMQILPKEKFLFYYELFEIYKKANELPQFIELCKQLSKSELKDFSNMVTLAQHLIDSNYVFIPKKNPIK